MASIFHLSTALAAGKAHRPAGSRLGGQVGKAARLRKPTTNN